MLLHGMFANATPAKATLAHATSAHKMLIDKIASPFVPVLRQSQLSDGEGLFLARSPGVDYCASAPLAGPRV